MGHVPVKQGGKGVAAGPLQAKGRRGGLSGAAGLFCNLGRLRPPTPLSAALPTRPRF